MEIYEPREDSELLQKYVKKLARGMVLDMGTGSGIQAETAAKKSGIQKVIAADINPKAKKQVKNKKIRFIASDLFSKIPKTKFDTIIFNPPYLPEDPGIEDPALYGGKNGYEILEQFLSQAPDYLKKDGFILIIFSSLTDKKQVDRIIEKNLLEAKLLETQKLPVFEEIYCYQIKKSDTLRDLNKKKVKNIQFLDRGKRGLVYTGKYKNKKIAVKVKRKESEAVERIQNEIFWLKKLNKKNIGPRLVFHNQNYLAYEFVEGDFIMDYIEKNKSKKQKIKSVLKKVFHQCFEMDRMGINKEEMHHPRKHIIVKYPKVTLIDFERIHQTEKPKNVTQFVQFVSSIRNLNKNKMQKLAQAYKKEMTQKNLKKIIKEIR